MSYCLIRVISWADGAPSPFDGQYLEWYDPERHSSQELAGFTLDPSRARRFEDAGAAFTEWRRVRMREGGLRPDGQPDRPLTAFTVEVTKIDE